MTTTARILATVATLALAAACSPPPDPGEALEGVTAARPTPPVDRPDFTFTDTRGRPWDFREATQGKLALLFFGYTHCPDVCPLSMARIAQALDSVPADLREGVEVVFVSVDPQRDTPQRLAAWLGGFDTTFVGVTAPQDEVDALMATFDFPATSFPDGKEGDDYGVGHPGVVWGFTPDGEGRLIWLGGTSAADYRNDVERVLAHAW